jgi:hypothetical protein
VLQSARSSLFNASSLLRHLLSGSRAQLTQTPPRMQINRIRHEEGLRPAGVRCVLLCGRCIIALTCTCSSSLTIRAPEPDFSKCCCRFLSTAAIRCRNRRLARCVVSSRECRAACRAVVSKARDRVAAASVRMVSSRQRSTISPTPRRWARRARHQPAPGSRLGDHSSSYWRSRYRVCGGDGGRRSTGLRGPPDRRQ